MKHLLVEVGNDHGRKAAKVQSGCSLRRQIQSKPTPPPPPHGGHMGSIPHFGYWSLYPEPQNRVCPSMAPPPSSHPPPTPLPPLPPPSHPPPHPSTPSTPAPGFAWMLLTAAACTSVISRLVSIRSSALNERCRCAFGVGSRGKPPVWSSGRLKKNRWVSLVNAHLNQGPLLFEQPNQQGHLCQGDEPCFSLGGGWSGTRLGLLKSEGWSIQTTPY